MVIGVIVLILNFALWFGLYKLKEASTVLEQEQNRLLAIKEDLALCEKKATNQMLEMMETETDMIHNLIQFKEITGENYDLELKQYLKIQDKIRTLKGEPKP